MASLRRPGGRWRLLAHEWLGRGDPSGMLYGTAHHVSSAPGKDDEHRAHHHLPRTEFDELVVGSAIHIEQQDAGLWQVNLGGVTVHIAIDRDGHPKKVIVHGPDNFAGAVDGCEYELAWSRHTGAEEDPHDEP